MGMADIPSTQQRRRRGRLIVTWENPEVKVNCRKCGIQYLVNTEDQEEELLFFRELCFNCFIKTEQEMHKTHSLWGDDYK